MSFNIASAQPLDFTSIELPMLDRVEAIRTASCNTLYVYTFASLFAWQADEQYQICLRDDAFLVKNGAEGENAYLFPCGTDSGKKALIDTLVEREKPTFFTISDEDKQFLEREYPEKFEFTECRNEFAYLYDKDEQIKLAGKAFKSLRHQINLGRAVADEWLTEALCDDNIGRALSINSHWAEALEGDDLADTMAAETALHNLTALNMWGLLFKADGEDVAYVAGTFVTPEIFDVSFCKVLDKRCDCFIKWLLYSALPQEVKTVDSEEDLGLDGLRRHKLLRRPRELTRIWKGTYIYE